MLWLPTGNDSVAHTVSGRVAEIGTQKPLFECLASHRGMVLLGRVRNGTVIGKG